MATKRHEKARKGESEFLCLFVPFRGDQVWDTFPAQTESAPYLSLDHSDNDSADGARRDCPVVRLRAIRVIRGEIVLLPARNEGMATKRHENPRKGSRNFCVSLCLFVANQDRDTFPARTESAPYLSLDHSDNDPADGACRNCPVVRLCAIRVIRDEIVFLPSRNEGMATKRHENPRKGSRSFLCLFVPFRGRSGSEPAPGADGVRARP